MTSTPRLALDGVSVEFGATRALASIDLQLEAGQIIGLLGHNGAGKSTLVNVVTGALAPTSGHVQLDGETLRLSGPRDASRHGISVIHQTPALAPNLSVRDNLFLGQPTTGRSRAERTRALDALARLGAESIDLDARVDSLGFGARQMVDLARSLMRGDVKVLLLDEPTAALGRAETDTLHALIRRLAAAGTTVVYVSHRLPDIVDVCDRIVVLRDGTLVEDRPVEGLDATTLARALAPELVEQAWTPVVGSERVLSVDALGIDARAGEVVGLFGVAAGEQFALLRALAGDGASEIDARLDGAVHRPTSPSAAIAAGVHSVAADRDRDGLVGSMSAIDNVFLPWRGRRIDAADAEARRRRTSRAGRAEAYRDMRAELSVRGPGALSPISAFSGGNRQKHLLAAWLFPVRPRVLLLAQPTQGVDIAAKEDIRRAVRSAAAQGTCVVVASAESDEIAGLCDRAYVLSGGRTRALDHSGAAFDAELLSHLLALIPEKDVTVA